MTVAHKATQSSTTAQFAFPIFDGYIHELPGCKSANGVPAMPIALHVILAVTTDASASNASASSPFTASNIIAGAIGSLLAVLVIWFCNDTLPRILTRFRRDEPLLPTKWKTTFSEGGKEYHETITLIQRGRRIEGQIALREASDEEIATYKFEGQFRHLTLTATYRSADPGDFEQGAFVLKFELQKKFKGQYIFWSEEFGRPITSEYVWEPST